MRLLLTGCFAYTEEQFHQIQSLGYDIHFMQQESGPLPVEAHSFDAVVCNGLFLSHPIEDFTQLKFIQLTSAGLDRVPMDEIERRQIKLFNARGVYGIPMAEWAVFRILEHYKQGCYFRKEQMDGHWIKHRGLREIVGTKIAILGAGNVGTEVAKRFHAFEADITGFDVCTTHKPMCFDRIKPISSLKEYIGDFDIIIITAPLLPSTYHLVSKEMLMKLKEEAIVVNIARGGLIDEPALCDFLQKRPDVFAALDVFESEPLDPASPLWKLSNVAISPHNSFVSNGNNKRMFDVILRNLRNFITQ
ncbi:hypothetical protein K0G60_04910 [Bacteroides fragilis]|jgi:hypothetical protein|nr:hypothetical protein [Bacteroides fragilis]